VALPRGSAVRDAPPQLEKQRAFVDGAIAASFAAARGAAPAAIAAAAIRPARSRVRRNLRSKGLS
jgi:hypothetical protein